mgnify:CR=1 FL=1
MADEDQDQDQDQDKKPKKQSVQLSGKHVIVILMYFPLLITFLGLAVKIIWSASTDANVLENSEALIALLAIVSTPLVYGLAKIWEEKDE